MVRLNKGRVPIKNGQGQDGVSRVNYQGSLSNRLECDTDNLKHAKPSRDIKLAITQARAAKGMTQRQLAQKMNVPPSLIQGYENGKAIPVNSEIASIEAALGAKLPRTTSKGAA